MAVDVYTLLEILLDAGQWPTYSFDTNVLGRLAEEAFNRNTFDGYLSYVLLTNQICEEYARILVREGELMLLLQLVPRGFGWRFPKQKPDQLGRNLEKL